MSLELRFVCSLRAGLHARPASVLARLASGFAADCKLFNLRTGSSADVKSVLALIAADVRLHDECRIDLSGADAERAYSAVHRCLEQDLPLSETEPEPLMPQPAIRLPAALEAIGIDAQAGVPIHPGVGSGRIVLLRHFELPDDVATDHGSHSRHAREQLDHALAEVQSRLAAQVNSAMPGAARGILAAHLEIATDSALREQLYEAMAEGRSAAQAVIQASRHFCDQLRSSPSDYVRERAADVVDVCARLREALDGRALTPSVVLAQPSVVVAEMLTPQQLLALDRRWLQALVFESASVNSHAAILARSLGIPTVGGVRNALQRCSALETVLVDARRGFVCAFTPAVRDFYEQESRVQVRRDASRRERARSNAITRDGHRLIVAANVASPEEARDARELGAEGVGLFRTELLFAARGALLTEEEQLAAYVAAVRAAPEGVIIRTLDIGADKPLPSLARHHEDNPFLGHRGVRVYRERRELLRTQLRAILRASAFGTVQVLAPMISCVEEVQWVKGELSQVRTELQAQGIACAPALRLGVMLEVPSACFILKELCAEVDFFSVGTNDLSQYFTAADRNNSKVAALAEPLHPGFIRLLKQVVNEIRAAGKWVGVCGEMAAELQHLPLMVGLGVDEISVSAAAIPALKECLRTLSAARCRDLLVRALDCGTAVEIRALLARESGVMPGSLLDTRMVFLQAPELTKTDALHTLSEALFIAGRTEDAGAVEQALWTREARYSTALGNGFAVPHCKSEALDADSIGVLRPMRPIDWGTDDRQSVQMIILLAMRAASGSDRHLEVFSKLARKLMDAEFRERLLTAAKPDETVALLDKELGLSEA